MRSLSLLSVSLITENCLRSFRLATFITFVIFIFTTHLVLAETNDAQTNFQKGLDYAKSQSTKNNFQKALSDFKPSESLKSKNGAYTENPPQTSYYSEAQSDSRELEKASREEVTKDEGYKDKDGNPVPTPGKFVTKTYSSRPIVKIDQKEEFMQKSKLVIDNANNIVMGESNKNINCEKQKMAACKTVHIEKICNESKPIRRVCEKVPNIITVDGDSYDNFSYFGEISPAADVHVGTFVVPITGTITSFSANFGSWHVNYGLWACDDKGGQYPGYLQNVYVSKSRARSCGEFVETMSYSNGNLNIPVEAGKPITFRFDGYVRDRCGRFGCDWHAWRNGSINRHWSSSHYDIVIRKKRKVHKLESWNDLPCNYANCKYIGTECAEAEGTRTIDGIPFALDCWRKKDIYECLEDSDNNCKQLRDQGCSSVKQTCRTRPDGLCAVQDEIFSCPVERCDETGDITCGKKPFCVGTSCTNTTPKKNNNFEKTASFLAAIADAAKQVSAQQISDINFRFIFKGRSMRCADAWTGAKDCCSDNPSGWAGFMHCDAEDKQLAQERFSGRAIYAGSYCNNKVPLTDICASRHSVYCVFDSKIARIVQEDGRYKQLGRSFWLPGDDDHDHSDCSGLSIADLQKLDFSKMDFSAIFAEVTKNIKQQENTKEILVPKTKAEVEEKLKKSYEKFK